VEAEASIASEICVARDEEHERPLPVGGHLLRRVNGETPAQIRAMMAQTSFRSTPRISTVLGTSLLRAECVHLQGLVLAGSWLAVRPEAPSGGELELAPTGRNQQSNPAVRAWLQCRSSSHGASARS
jgi:hypothetical protein